jgi:NADPH:quinone reductase-like Zn-dependent oxidoreductase
MATTVAESLWEMLASSWVRRCYGIVGDALNPLIVVGVAGVTAWRTVTELARVTAEDRALVLGAAGGVGSIIVSLAHRLGAAVWAQSDDSGAVAWLKARGADRVVTLGAGQLASELARFRPTVAFDPLSDGFTGAAVESLARRGRLVIFGTSAGPTGTIQLKTLYRSALTIAGYGGLRDSDEILGAALEGIERPGQRPPRRPGWQGTAAGPGQPGSRSRSGTEGQGQAGAQPAMT